MISQVDDQEIIALLETLDEILQEGHDVEIAASAKAIRALLAERDALKAEMEKMRGVLHSVAFRSVDDDIYWCQRIAREALTQTSTTGGEE